MTVQKVDPAKPITLTEAAINYFNEYVSSQEAIGIRLALKGGGCAGFEYDWSLVNEFFSQQEKYVQHYENFVFILDEHAYDYLIGSTVDLESMGIKGSQIVVNSPKQVSACGCGESVTFDV